MQTYMLRPILILELLILNLHIAALRLDIWKGCNAPVGIADGRIEDYAMVGSSVYNNDRSMYGAQRARLNLTRTPQGFRTDMSMATGSWIRVELKEKTIITGVATQGHGDVNEWVKQYYLLFERDGVVTSFTNNQAISGNSDRNTIKYNTFYHPAATTSVILMPTSFNRNVGLRLELYGCPLDFYFVAWFTMDGYEFDVNRHYNSSSIYYKKTVQDATSLIQESFSKISGFISAKILRLSPNSLAGFSSCFIRIEVKIYCIESSLEEIESEMKSILTSQVTGFSSSYFDVKYPRSRTCLAPLVIVPLGKTPSEARVIKPSQKTVIIRAIVTNRCNSSDEKLSCQWEQAKVSLELGLIDPFAHSSMIRNGKLRPSFFLRLYGDGYFLLRCVVRFKNQSGIMAYDSGFVNVVQPMLVAKIQGPETALWKAGTVILSAAGSYDAVEKQLGPIGLRFSWSCRRREDRIFVRVTQSVGCFGFRPEISGSRRQELVINTTTMEPDRTYVFKVTVTKLWIYQESTNHTMRVEKFASIICRQNCNPKATTSRRTVIEVVRHQTSCHSEVLRYDWSLYVLRDQAWEKIENLEEMTSGQIDSPIIIFPGKIFLPGREHKTLENGVKYKVEASIYVEDGMIKDDLTFHTNAPPFPSNETAGCFVRPTLGYTLKTAFVIWCSGWSDDDEPLTYEFRYRSNTSVVVLQSGPGQTTKAILPLGNPRDDYNFTLEILVKDRLGSFTTQEVIIKVEPLKATGHSNSIKSIVIDKNSTLDVLLQKSEYSDALHVAHAFLSMCREENFTEQETRSVNDVILEKMNRIELDTLAQVSQLSAIVSMATDTPQFMSEAAMENAVDVLEKVVGFLSSQGSDANQDVLLVQQASISPLQAISNILNSTTERANKHPRDEKNVDLAMRVLKMTDSVGSAVLDTKAIGEDATVIRTKQMTILLEKQTPEDVAKKKFGQKGEVLLPSAEVLLREQPSNISSLGIQVIEFAKNPYTWDRNSTEIKSLVMDFSMKTRTGDTIEVSGLADPIGVILPVHIGNYPDGSTDADVQENEYFVKPGVADENMRYHVVDIPTKATVGITIKPQTNKRVQVFVRYDVRPTSQHYDVSTVLPDFSSCAAEQVYNSTSRNCSSDPFLFTISSHLTGNSGRHVLGIKADPKSSGNVVISDDVTPPDNKKTQQKRTRKDCGNHNRRGKRSCINVKDPPTTPPPTPRVVIPRYNASTDVKYTMSITVASCMYWSKIKRAWVDDGCQVGPKSVAGKLQCLCTHLSVFGGEFFVAPNPIDFDKVWSEFSKLGETGNFVVLTTVCSVLGLYLIALVFTWRADKSDTKVVSQVYLDECEEDGFTYDISVQTGMWQGYGTTANVALIIYGEEGKTHPIALADTNFKNRFFARGSVNNFTLCLPQSLGPLFKIAMWHDNSGNSPSWYLQQVVILDVNSDKKYHFLGNRWLALEKGSGNIDAQINVATEKDLGSFRNLFYSRTARNLGDGHLWLSVFTRPPQNPFTRSQRLSCCLSVLFAAMVTNAMFYQFGASPEDGFKLGPLELSWTQIKIGIQSSIVSIPVNVMVVMIFRNVKRKSSGHDREAGLRVDEGKASGCLPAFFVYVGWMICLLTSLTSAAFVVFYSLMWGADVSNQWLTSISISFIQDVLLTQPFKVVAIAALLSVIIKKPPEQDTAVHGRLFRRESQEIAISALKGDELKVAKEFQIKLQQMTSLVLEIVSFLLFTLLLFVVAYGNRTTSRFLFTKAMQDMVGGFQKVNDAPTFWNWTKAKLIPGLYNVQWYNGREFEYDEGFISTREAFMVGMPRLRQVRINPESKCPSAETAPRMTPLFPRCLARYSQHNEYTTPYSLPGWIPIRNSTLFELIPGFRDICPKPWRYKSAKELGTLDYVGLRYKYPGGGFAADVGYNSRSAMNVVNDLEKNAWINDKTIIVLVEFTVFEPATALFSSVKYIYEIFPSGGRYTSTRIDTLTLYYPNDAGLRPFYQVCQLLLIVLVFIFLLMELAKLYSNGCKYFKRFWNWVELLFIMTSASAVSMIFFKESHTRDFVKNVQANPFETSSMDFIIMWADLEIALLALVIFIVTVKLLSLLRFNRHICQMSGTLRHCAKEMSSFTLVFAGLIMAFTQLGMLVFGNDIKAYSSVYATLRSLLLMLVGGRMYLRDTANVDPLISPIFAFSYMIIMMVVLMNMFCAILCESHDRVKGLRGEQFADADLGEFMKDYLSKRSKSIWNSLIEFFKDRKPRRLNENRDTGLNEESLEERDEEIEEFQDSEQARRRTLLVRLASEECIDDIDDLTEVAPITRCVFESLSSVQTLAGDDIYLSFEDTGNLSEPAHQEDNARTIWDRT